MNVGLKILFVVIIIVLVIIILLALLLIIPFRYLISLIYNDGEISFDFKYSVITFNVFIALKSKIKYYLKALGITIFDSDSKKNKDKVSSKDKNDKVILNEASLKPSLADTDFLQDKSISEELRASDEDAKKLLKSAKKIEKEQLEDLVKTGSIDDKSIRQKIDLFIDNLHNIIPPDMKYVLKKVSAETLSLIKKLSPTDVDVDISYGSDNPYLVGLSFAILAPAIAITDGDINAKPSFNKDGVSAKIELARRVPLITIVIPVVRLLLDKKFRNIVFSKKPLEK